MTNPRNNFNDFFNDPRPAMEKFRPSPEKVVEALMILTSQDHEWYKDQAKRGIILTTMSALAEDLKRLPPEEAKKAIPVHAAAFLMVLGDLAYATIHFASKKEIELYHTPHNEDEDEE